MIIDGVKMACEACVRGHRVSGCNHSDRKLLPIAKKGRPVSQCNHCRHMRKSRSAHVKCDCGERIAAMKEQAKNGVKSCISSGTATVGSHVAGVAATSGSATPEDADSKSETEAPCLCCHGGRCTCALKKEPQHLDAVPELATTAAPTSSSSVSPVPVEAPRKPRLISTQSEGSLTTFANGHHKPTHKHHHSLHGSSPYSIPTVGHTGHNFGEHNGCAKAAACASSSCPSPPRRIKSEHSSPNLRTYPALQMPNTITPLELTPRPALPATPQLSRSLSGTRMRPGLSVNTNQSSFTMQNFGSQELLESAGSDGYQFSAGLYPPASAGWPSQFGQFGAGPFEDVEPLQTPSYDPTQWETQVDVESFMSGLNVPALTNSTSGDEHEDLNGFPLNNGIISSDSSDPGADSDAYGLSANSSFVRLPLALTSGGDDFGLTTTMPFEASVTAGVDAGDFGVGALAFGTSDYAPSNMSDDRLSPPQELEAKVPGGVTYVTPPAIPPQDDDFLWMAPWAKGPQTF